MNKQRALAVYRDIKKHWKNYDQSVFHEENSEVGECLSTHCVAGFCELRALGIKRRDNISKEEVHYTSPYRTNDIAQAYLGLTDDESQYLFSGGTTWREVSQVLRTGKLPKWYV
jgi:hypothetical protein